MDTDVIVVGAGPVGLMLAGELRLGGARVTVLERLAAPTTESRASTLHARTMELFDQRGLLEVLGPVPGEPRGHFGGLALDLGGQPTRHPGQWKVPQARTERLLADWASGLGARIRREHDVRDIDESGSGVLVTAGTPDGTVRLSAGYVVGCDGDDSAVRVLAPFEFPGSPPTRELLRCDVSGVDVPDRRFERLDRGLAVAATRDGVTRLMVHEFGRRPVTRASAPDFAELVAAWKRVTGEDVGGGTPLWLSALDDESRLVTQYRNGRVLLAGDAAHRQLPVGGQAINLGIQDAVNLGWKLAAQVTGRAPPTLLDSYHDERHPEGRRTLDSIEAQASLLLGDHGVDAVRDVVAQLLELPAVAARLAERIGGLDVRYGTAEHALVGARMPHVDLDSGAGRSSTTVSLHDGHGVLLDLSGDPARHTELAGALGEVPGRVALVSARGEGTALPPGTRTVLVRPDGHVAWAAGRDGDPGPALRRWFGSDAAPGRQADGEHAGAPERHR
ncbi:oxygenase [Haloactinopolyspora alba]|uniref:Oxygenase n=1 Tax=Haloactinopolyspora alba TaxID=648780 RepID=A0A2P8E971_9ACTN|nr:FAD-dependent monooxygenase [Haloactinopolyspora alba]PSL05988.1 oxygenase [Haloactinopolyspora alba]